MLRPLLTAQGWEYNASMTSDVMDRRLLRLQGYDYSQTGGYFITICTGNRLPHFGYIDNSKVRLFSTGEIARQAWLKLPDWFPYVVLDCYVIMPNHFHGVLLLLPQHFSSDVAETEAKRASASGGLDGPAPGALAKSLSSVIQAYKSRVARECNQHCGAKIQLWQRGYYDHVIRDQRGLERIREYVTWNPVRWELDKENPQHTALNPFYDWLETCSGAPPI